MVKNLGLQDRVDTSLSCVQYFDTASENGYATMGPHYKQLNEKPAPINMPESSPQGPRLNNDIHTTSLPNMHLMNPLLTNDLT